jgi:hypothetical protein
LLDLGGLPSIHRTVAAREAGRKVKARIKGYCRLMPSAFAVHDGWLWRRQADGRLRSVAAIDEAERKVLLVLGVAGLRR